MHVEATLPSAVRARHVRPAVPAPRPRGRCAAGFAAAACAAAGLVLAAAAAGVRRVVVEGESMRPALAPGDRLVVVWLPRRAALRPGAVVAAADPREPGRLLVKRVAALEPDGRVLLQGDNTAASTDSRTFGPVARGAVWGVARYRYAPPSRTGRLQARRARFLPSAIHSASFGGRCGPPHTGERSEPEPEMPSDFAFDVVDDVGVRVMALHGQLDLVNADRVRDAIAQMDGSAVVVDIQGLQFMDSSGIAALLEARSRIVASGRTFQLRGAQGIVRRALEVTGLVHLLSD